MSQKQKRKSKPAFKFYSPDDRRNYKVEFLVAEYANNGNLCLMLECVKTGELYACVTTNMEKLPPYMAHVKIVNENEGMVKFLLENKMGRFKERITEDYPLFAFDPAKIRELDTENWYVKE